MSHGPDKCYGEKDKAGRGQGRGRVWRWDVAILKKRVRKGFCEKVTFEQNGRLAKESIIRENVLGTGINRARTPEWDCSWWVWGTIRRLLWPEQSEEASKTGGRRRSRRCGCREDDGGSQWWTSLTYTLSEMGNHWGIEQRRDSIWLNFRRITWGCCAVKRLWGWW